MEPGRVERGPGELATGTVFGRNDAAGVADAHRTDHAAEDDEAAGSRWIDGKATLTTLLSTIAMLDPRIVAISASRLEDAAKDRSSLAAGTVELLIVGRS